MDDALPLEDVIKPNAELRSLLEDIDTSKVRMWLFTNAYITHGKRVVKLLQIDDLFEGITYCDYGSEKFYCKPHAEMYDKAMQQAGVKSNQNCYFVGKSKLDVTSRQNIEKFQMILISTPKLHTLGVGIRCIFLTKQTPTHLNPPASIKSEALWSYGISSLNSSRVKRRTSRTAASMRHYRASLPLFRTCKMCPTSVDLRYAWCGVYRRSVLLLLTSGITKQ